MAEREVARRLAAIVAADVAGYSRLIGLDEEGTLSTLRKYRVDIVDPKVAEYRGRVVNTAGDRDKTLCAPTKSDAALSAQNHGNRGPVSGGDYRSEERAALCARAP